MAGVSGKRDHTLMMNRLGCLPVEHIFRKMDYFSHFKGKNFAGYRSPWVPVSPSNLPKVKQHLEKKGGLIANTYGTEIPYPEGRNVEYGREGKMRYQLSVSLEGQHAGEIKFVWIDGRTEDPSEMAGDFKDYYEQYSEHMCRLMDFIMRRQCLGDVEFPLFHGTHEEHANEILHFGFDYNEIQASSNGHYGYGLSAANDPWVARQLFNAEFGPEVRSGIVMLRPFSNQSVPTWLNLNELTEYGPTMPVWQLNKFLVDFSDPIVHVASVPSYTWQMVCKELFHDSMPVTSIYHKGVVNIYEPDPFAYYEPFEVMAD